MNVIYWGTYDKGKPRNRIMLRGLLENGVEVTEIHRGVWDNIEDKTQMKGNLERIKIVALWLLSYPKLIYRYLRSDDHDYVVIGYLGHLDVLLLFPFARLRRKKIVWDAFISLYDTMVNDRRILSQKGIAAGALHLFEKIVCHAADLVILDTDAHASYFRDEFSLDNSHCVSVPVGAEQEAFPFIAPVQEKNGSDSKRPFTVLFYGQFIPLHGIEYIIGAAKRLSARSDIQWVLIGTGQEREKIQSILADSPLANLQWLTWVNYEDLQRYIHKADVCLGIFGTSGKASRVIPNKVYQIVSCGKPIITRSSPAMRELFAHEEPGALFVDAGDAEQLALSVLEMKEKLATSWRGPFFAQQRELINPKGVGRKLLDQLSQMADERE